MNNKNTHANMQLAVNVVFTQIHAKKGITVFSERGIVVMIKEFRQLDEGAIPGKPVVFPLNHY